MLMKGLDQNWSSPFLFRECETCASNESLKYLLLPDKRAPGTLGSTDSIFKKKCS